MIKDDSVGQNTLNLSLNDQYNSVFSQNDLKNMDSILRTMKDRVWKANSKLLDKNSEIHAAIALLELHTQK